MIEREARFPRIARTALIAALLPGMAGCASGAFESGRPYQQVYMLSGSDVHHEGGALAADLVVTRPVVRPGLDTDRIAVGYADRRLDYLAGSRWGGTIDVVVQSLLVESLRNSARLRTVQGDFSAFGAGYLLQTELTDFQAEYGDAGGPPQAHVGLIVTVGRDVERRPLVTFTADARATAKSNTLPDVVAAFEAAYHDAARLIVARTVETLTEAEAASAAAAASGNSVSDP